MKNIFKVLAASLVFIGLNLLPIEDTRSKIMFAILMSLSYIMGFIDGDINKEGENK